MLAALILACVPGRGLFAIQTHWVVTWGASPSPQLGTEDAMRAAGLLFSNQTLRQIVHVSIGGEAVRIRMSNIGGATPVEIGSLHVAIRAKGSGVRADSDRVVTFSGQGSLSLPPDAVVASDPISLVVPAGADLAVSLYLPAKAAAAGIHYSALQASYVAAGDRTAAAEFPAHAGTLYSWSFLAGADILAEDTVYAVAAIGDSITDGVGSTAGTNSRWPDFLAARLLRRGDGHVVGVLDAGIGGNRILHDAARKIQFGIKALARFDRDVLAQPGVRCVIVLEGINDLGQPGASAPASESVSTDDVVAGLLQLIRRAHAARMRIFGGTLTPFEGARGGFYTPEKALRRQALNTWIRSGNAFDGVIDFDRAIRDPAHPSRLLPAFDSGDHLHPNDRGYAAMADAVDLSLFQ
jgi:lysophospholipase L1-like esterase